VQIVDEPVLEDMYTMGYAHWNETFDLLLLLVYSVDLPDDSEAQRIVTALDKTKFETLSSI